MRHGRSLLKLSRKTKPRYRLLRNLVTCLVQHERLRTTKAKAKAMRGFADKMVTLGKATHLTPERKRVLLGSFLYTTAAVDKLIQELVPRLWACKGNYAVIRHDGRRRGDGAEMAVIQYKDNPYELYEQELAQESIQSKVPEFTLKILRQEQGFFQNALETMQDAQQKEFFLRQLDRVARELALKQAKP